MKNESRKQINKYLVQSQIEDLNLLNYLANNSSIITISGELEIEPFNEFSIAFQAEYWYLKYQLLKKTKLNIKAEEFPTLITEKDLNVISLDAVNENNIRITFSDGDCFISIPEEHNNFRDVFEESFSLQLIS